MLHAAYLYRCHIQRGLSMLGTTINSAKTAQPIEMPFVLQTHRGPKTLC